MPTIEYVATYPPCDAEVGSVSRGWHTCRRPAHLFVDRELTGGRYRLYFCPRHVRRADTPPRSVITVQKGQVCKDA